MTDKEMMDWAIKCEAEDYERRKRRDQPATGIEAACAKLDEMFAGKRQWSSVDEETLRTVIAAARESDANAVNYYAELTRTIRLEQWLDAEREQRQQLFESASGWSAEAIKQEKRAEQAEARVSKLEAALRPFARFAEQWDAQPIGGIDDEVYAIHAGTEWESSLRLSDCRKARAALAEGGE